MTKPNLKLILIALCTASVMLMSFGAGAVQTRGGVTCDQWLADSKANAWEISADHFWLLGYLSGLAVGLNQDFLKGNRNEAIYSWMESYCAANPLKSVGDAANVLAREWRIDSNGDKAGKAVDTK